MTDDDLKPAWFRCSRAPRGGALFTCGWAYEVHSHTADGPLVMTNGTAMVTLPQPGYRMEPYDPWGHIRKGDEHD